MRKGLAKRLYMDKDGNRTELAIEWQATFSEIFTLPNRPPQHVNYCKNSTYQNWYMCWQGRLDVCNYPEYKGKLACQWWRVALLSITIILGLIFLQHALRSRGA